MGMDIRLPVGVFFSLVGLILALYGLLADPWIYQKSLSINVNLYWGIVLGVFGAVMLLLGRRALRATVREAADHHADPGGQE